ncbi:MAG: GNAT family N-acetyltransferase [Clostridiales bacterium]|nr:GNAT family N-acetyltransferase [Clostridiales bacterium]
MKFKEIIIDDVEVLAEMFVDTFNSSPWNDKWTIKTASKRLHQMINCEGFKGIMAYEEEVVLGMILGSEEQYYNGIVFVVKEFCINNKMRNKGFGTILFKEFEERIKSIGVTEIVLNTLKDNSTEGFYKKMGLKVYDDMMVMGKNIRNS